MQSRITLFNNRGYAIAEVAAYAVRSWVLNGVGKALFSISSTDSACTLENLQFGNFVYIEHDRAPEWGGVIWTPRAWSYGSVEIAAYSGEFQFKRRRGESKTLYGTAGSLFSQIINIANAVGDARIVFDAIWGGGIDRQQTMKYDTLFDVVNRLATRAGNDWMMVPQKTKEGQINFLARWFQQAGVDRNFRVELGFDQRLPAGIVLKEQGDIYNDVMVFGGAAQTTITPTAIASDTTSRSTYGLTQGVFGSNDLTQTNLQAQADAAITYYKNPRKTFNIELVDNVTKNPFDYTDVGDRILVKTENVGFSSNGALGVEAYARIIAKEFDDKTGVMTLVTNEVLA